MDFLTVEEKMEMILIYGEAGRNLDDAANIYAQRFPDKIRSRTSFHRTAKQFTTNWSVQPKKRVRRAIVTGGNNEINVLAATAANPHASTRELSGDLGVSQRSSYAKRRVGNRDVECDATSKTDFLRESERRFRNCAPQISVFVGNLGQPKFSSNYIHYSF
ncbi:unnamed protein product [Brassicogethes aeneus]|uniref:DUF4817 domain-containing protein n=1 Tax=Brassicogethes aeneus TaxID=1431903 RepID=A0A9P0FFS4_BRAAE|nr:unnamed protein product [Brassicogethes aeneus]